MEVTTDRAPVYPRVIDDLAPAARHVLEQDANNTVEADHGRLKARLRPMRGLKTSDEEQTRALPFTYLQPEAVAKPPVRWETGPVGTASV